jgi:unsaturated rhamnogalacturonyl hydrolase
MKILTVIPLLVFYVIINKTTLAQTTAGEASSLPLSQQMANTAMSLWKDSLTMDATKPAKWTYDQGVVLKGIEGVWNKTGDGKYFKYIQHCMDFFVSKDGMVRTYKQDEFNIDNVNNGRILLLLYKVTNDERYWKAATLLRDQLRSQPRTSEGGFWHKKIYPYQMWLDGLYMGEPFYAEYAAYAHDDTAFNDIARQFILMEKHSRDAKTGLLYHAWDESKQQKWADAAKGHSPNFWGRAMGWFGMALVDVLDNFPANHPQRKELIAILDRYAAAVAKVQDAKTGLWWDVLNLPNYKNNYLEASASSMFVCALAKSVRMGYLSASYLTVAKKGYDGIVKKFLSVDAGAQVNLEGTVSVSGLGGNPYRDGSFDYYMSEKVVQNDPKGMGAFIQAANEMEMTSTQNIGKGKTVTLDNYFNNEWKKDATGIDVPFHYTWGDKANSGFSMLGSVFDIYGVKKNTLTAAPTKENLKNANIYIIVDPDTEKETAKPNFVQQKDVDEIADWVKKGGVLLLMSNDSGNAEFTHFNKLAEKFGIHFNEDSKNRVQGNNYEQGAIEIPFEERIFHGISKVYIKELSTITFWPASPKEKIARVIDLKNGKDNIIAIAQYGKGTVFAVGDPWLYNEYADGRKLPMEYENYKAANDLVKWLIKQVGPQPLKRSK